MMNDPNIIIAQANAKLNNFSFLDIFDKNPKYEDAKSLFERAGNLYKMAKQYNLAANAYIKAAECSSKLGYTDDIIFNYVDVFNCYKNFDIQKAIEYCNKVIDFYKQNGNYARVIKFKKELIDIYDNNLDYENVIKYCMDCLELLDIERNDSFTKNAIYNKLAHTNISMGKYKDAGFIFQKMASDCMYDNGLTNILKYRSSEYILCSVLCHIYDDIVAAHKVVDAFIKTNPFFTNTREYQFANGLINAIVEENMDNFTNAIREYQEIKPLSPWQIELLYSVKERLQGNDLL